ncbi:MAG: CsiV family protein [Candidatus Berkiellales bacterium]
MSKKPYYLFAPLFTSFSLFTSLFTLLMLLLYSIPSYAKEPKWVHVELLIFENKDKAAFQNYSSIAGVPVLTGAINLNPDPQENYGQLPPHKLTLNKVKQTMEKEKYPLLLHTGWRQMLTDKNNADRVHLVGERIAQNNHQVDGIIKLALGKHLLMDADLLFHKMNENGELSVNTYRLKESSRLKYNEINYIDHPLFGVIMMITAEK